MLAPARDVQRTPSVRGLVTPYGERGARVTRFVLVSTICGAAGVRLLRVLVLRGVRCIAGEGEGRRVFWRPRHPDFVQRAGGYARRRYLAGRCIASRAGAREAQTVPTAWRLPSAHGYNLSLPARIVPASFSDSSAPRRSVPREAREPPLYAVARRLPALARFAGEGKLCGVEDGGLDDCGGGRDNSRLALSGKRAEINQDLCRYRGRGAVDHREVGAVCAMDASVDDGVDAMHKKRVKVESRDVGGFVGKGYGRGARSAWDDEGSVVDLGAGKHGSGVRQHWRGAKVS
ncbi:hypothetical protein B0H17DRAFT_1145873 [Mycena rosella]|uniref:Uncharacterized protein n=1 Tax=Mycena rosella TaxID=1033263 RepID=A0AAD7CQ49_MYCRO|nr:hypothetical protein B0H17DRAFT_1145873 [Mycena rosella]